MGTTKKKQQPKTIVSYNNVSVKVWDDQAIKAVNDVAKALLNMSELFKSQNIQVTGIHVENKD